MLYTEKEKNEIERVLKVFEKHIRLLLFAKNEKILHLK